MRPLEAADLPELGTAWSHALQARLRASERFLVRDGSSYDIDLNDEGRAQVLALAARFDAQFVIAGRIVSLETTRGSMSLGGLGSLPLPTADTRHLEVELHVFDGWSGVHLKRLTHTAQLRGQVVNSGHRPLQGGFLGTALGTTMAGLLDRQREDIEDELACLPMQARIVRAQGGEIHLDAGFTSNLQPGDRLRLVQRHGNPAGSGSESTWMEKTVGEVSIRQVFPESSIGQLEGNAAPDWRLNGFVRAW